MNSKTYYFLWITALVSLLGACSSDNLQDLRDFTEVTKQKYKGQIEPLPDVANYENYRYQVMDHRDPFRPSMSLVRSMGVNRTANGLQPDTRRSKDELEQYSLDSLTMVGTLLNDGETWAIVRAPDNGVYRVRAGNYLGQNYGKIIAIKETQIELKEIVADGLGGWIEKPNQLKLSQ